MKTANILLAAGLICAALGAGLFQFVMIGLIGVALFVVAFSLLLGAGIAARPAGELPLWRRLVGAALYGVGMALLLAAAGYASSLAYDQAMSSRPEQSAPSVWHWIILGLSSFLPVLIIMLGLRCRTQWSWRRCSVWGGAALCVVPTALVLFWLLTTVSPLTA